MGGGNPLQTRQRWSGKKNAGTSDVAFGPRRPPTLQDLWKAMPIYLDEWRGEKTISWVKAHAEDGGAVTNDHEK